MNKIFFFVVTVILICLLNSCGQTNSTVPAKVERDTTINPVNAYSELFFDSLHLENYLKKNKWHDSLKKAIRNFYNERNFQYAWFNNEGFTEQAFHFQNLLNEYISYSGDSSVYNPFVKNLLDSTENAANPLVLPDSVRFVAEVNMSSSFLRYSRRAYQGNIPLHQRDLNWFIPRKRINPVALLDSFIKTADRKDIHEPVNEQYQLLKQHLLRYYKMQRLGNFPIIAKPVKSYRLGDTTASISSLKKRLIAAGDYTSQDTTPFFSTELLSSVKKFQQRYGLEQDGVVGGNTLRYLNEPIDKRIKQILVNMERMRWIPEQPKGDFILVNIPQFRLTVFENGKPAFGMKIIVGTSQHKTVIFTGSLKFVVFSPYWNVPPGILKNEVLPAIRRSSSYLERNHMEWHGNTVRQKPGPWNALGLVKFLFPNSYNIYLHDTPTKGLFEQEKRTFSHGCIRIEQPQKMAEWVLRKQPSWTKERIVAAMNAGNELFVNVNDPVPVFVGYFTAWVDNQGQINFRDDVYGHDKKLAAHLFTE